MKSAPRDPLRTDAFRSPAGIWRTYYGDDSSRFVQRGQLHIEVNEPQTVSYAGPQDGEDLGDFLLEFEAAHLAGTLDNEMGVIFRRTGDDFYYFNVSSDGYYALDKYIGGEWETIVEATPSDALETGEGAGNRLGVLAEGSSLTLLANDTERLVSSRMTPSLRADLRWLLEPTTK